MITKKLPPYTHQYIQSTDFKGAVESRMTMNYQVTHSQRPLNFEINEVMNMMNINKFAMNAKITQETTSPSYNVYLQHYLGTKLNTTTTWTRGVPQKKILRVSHRSHIWIWHLTHQVHAFFCLSSSSGVRWNLATDVISRGKIFSFIHLPISLSPGKAWLAAYVHRWEMSNQNDHS